MGNKGRKRKSGGRSAAVVLESVTRREQSLVLFHLLGKVLYNKRIYSFTRMAFYALIDLGSRKR